MSKKFLIKLLIMFFVSVIFILFIYNDYFLYKRPIMKVDKIINKYDSDSDIGEKHITQYIYGTIKNGNYKNKRYKVINHTSTSGVFDEKVKKNSELFVEIKEGNKLAIGINEVKRDKYLAILFVIFIDSIILVAGKKGLKTLISLFVNILVSAASIFYFQKHIHTTNMLFLYFIVSVIFIISSLYITNGKHKKTLAAVCSSIVSLFVTFFLAFIIIKLYKKPIPYWTLDYIEAVHDYENFFYVTLLLSGLGAIMDIAITISSSLSELIDKDKNITVKALRKSGKEISKDIIGTMTNVMLFTCFTSIIPMTFLMMKNNIVIGEALQRYGQVELIVVLTSCIAIALSILISQYVSILILKKGSDK